MCHVVQRHHDLAQSSSVGTRLLDQRRQQLHKEEWQALVEPQQLSLDVCEQRSSRSHWGVMMMVIGMMVIGMMVVVVVVGGDWS